MRLGPVRNYQTLLKRYFATAQRRTMAYPTTSSSPSDLVSILPDKFEAARRSGELFYFPSSANNVYSSGRRFNICCCPALLNKEQAKSDILASIASDSSPDHKRQRTNSSVQNGAKAKEKSKQNPLEPFKPPYSEDLYVGHMEGIGGEPGVSLLLNKYAVLRDHVLLCPTTFEPQHLPPTPHQLASAYLFLLAASRHPKPRRMMGFYNAGHIAGASQKWRHIQVVEVPDGRAPVEDWLQTVRFEQDDEAIALPNLPYLHIVHPLHKLKNLPNPPSPNDLESMVDILAPALMKCLDLVFQSIRIGQLEGETGWNLLITLDHLHLIPRSKAEYPLPSPHHPVELNACAYAGMFLVRSEEENKTLLEAADVQGGLDAVLRHCGVPREWGEQAMDALNAHRGQMEDMDQLAQ